MGSEKWSTARELRAEDVTDSQTTRFWGRVARYGECWDFTGHLNHGGYGVLVIGTKARSRTVLAHRLAYALTFGPVPKGVYVLHSCDRRVCVNPAHLSLGTHEDNMRQKRERGRAPIAIGELNPRARLTAAQVRDMRSAYADLRWGQRGPYRRRMAERYGVSERAIEAAIHGERWKAA